ncbi:MAG: ABC transporter permease [Leptospirales bacterium]|nr:ABC transporter permease [Leptospirales bacterium]
MYRRSALGPLWALLFPIAYLFVFIFFRLLFGLSNPEGVPMIPFLFSGLINWLLFSSTIVAVHPSLVSNVSILKKIPVNPLIFVGAGSLLPLTTYVIYLVLMEGVAIFYGYYPSIHHIALPFLGLTILAFAIGLGLFVAALGIYRTDIIQVLPVLIQLGMFATPIFFSAAIVPESLQWAITGNPIAHCVNMFRDVLFNNTWPNWSIWGWNLLVVAAVWALALPMFIRTTRYLSDMY